MKLFALAFAIPALLLGAVSARAQSAASVVTTCGQLSLPLGYASSPLSEDITGTLCSAGGGGGGGGGPVTAAANSYALGSIIDLGTGATPGIYTVNGRLSSLVTALGSPFQAGGSIGNTSFAATQSGTWNVNNISGTVNLPTGAATSANQPTNAAQGSTTSGQTGHLLMGAVTTAAPGYTTAQTDPISLDTAGNIRINCVTGCSSAGGGNFNVGVIPTVTASAYAAGQAFGGLQTVSIGSTNSLTGILTQVSVKSKSGLTGNVVVYVWDKNPTGTTCTDKTNFVVSQADNEHLIIGAPVSLNPALAVTAQDTSTYAAAANLTGNFANGSTNTDLYVCILANAAITPASTTEYSFNLQGVKDEN